MSHNRAPGSLSEMRSNDPVSDVCITIFDNVAAFQDWWDRTRPAAHMLAFQHPHVMGVWERTLGASVGVKTFVARVDDVNGTPLMAIFLMIDATGKFGESVVQFMDRGVIDYNAPILFEPIRHFAITSKDIWSRIRAALPQHDRVLLEKMPATVKGALNPLWNLGKPGNGEKGHLMSLPKDWATIEREKSGHKIMKAAQRNLRQLSDIAPVKMVIAECAKDRLYLIDTLISEKRRRFLGMGIADMFDRPGVEAFYRDCVELDGITRLSGLFVGDEVVATNFGFIDSERFYGVLTATARERWSRYSCGNLHFQLLLRWATEQGLTSFDFGIGDEEYKMFWCDQHIELRDVRAIVSPAGYASEIYKAAQWRVCKLAKKCGVQTA